MTATKITNSDRAAVVRDAWSRAYVAAIAASEPVRLHLGPAFREAWAEFRRDRAEGRERVTMTACYEERYGRSDRLMARQHLGRLLAAKAAATAAAVEDHWSTYGPAGDATPAVDDDFVCDLDEPTLPAPVAVDARQALVDRIARNDEALSEQRARLDQWWATTHSEPPEHLFERMDDTHAFGIDLRAELAGLESAATAQPVVPVQLDLVAWLAAQPAMVPQPVQQQQAQAVSPEVARLREQERDLTWDVEHLEALARERFEHGSDRGQLDAVARMEAKWDEREEVRAKIRSLQSAL